MSATHRFSPGVLYGSKAYELMAYANEADFAIPYFTVNTTAAINGALSAAAKAGSPVGMQLDPEGSAFFAGKGLSERTRQASVVGAVAAALYVHTMAKAYGVPVLLTTANAKKNDLDWLEGLLQAGADFYAQRGQPLFTGHRLDFSEETFEENLRLSKKYLAQTSSMNMTLIVALGSAARHGSREDAPVDEADQFTSPTMYAEALEVLSNVSTNFAFSGYFGQIGRLREIGLAPALPALIKNAQAYIKAKYNLAERLPLLFAAYMDKHTKPADLEEAILHGAVLVNADYLLYDALWEGVGYYVAQHADRTQEDDTNDLPNHFTNPARWMTEGEDVLAGRLEKAFEQLKAVGRLGA